MNRFYFARILFAGLGLLLAGCGSNTQVSTIQITPASQALAAGQTAQFTATGLISHGTHPTTSQDVTSQVTWTSSVSGIATMSASGLATAVAAGTTTITASMAGAVPATATLSVTGSSGVGGDVVSLSVIPGQQSVASAKQTSQFIAIGTTASGSTLDVTAQAAWGSSSSSVATINLSGLATGVGKGTTTITAVFTNPDKTIATANSTLTVIAGLVEPITDLTISPEALSLSGGGQQTGQLVALATNGTTGLKEDVTNSTQLKWISSIQQIATVSASGQVTGVGTGSAIITAQWTNPDASVVSANATVTVSSVSASSSLLSLTIIPSIISVGDLQDAGNFIAIGTFSTSPTVRDLTNSVTWISSFPDYFPVSSNSGGTQTASGGIVTAYAAGSATIIAEATGPDGSLQTATATFNCPLVLPNPPTTAGSCYEGQFGPLKATLTLYGEGLNTTHWLITAPSATGTLDVIHCGPGWTADGNTGGSVCTGIYPIGSTVILTAPAEPGVEFGGWTYNCTPTVPVTATGTNKCQIVLGSTNAAVGAIFNNPTL
ncbi:MAG: Ig-like domain-containing protein [Terracidiphilus sp.]|nr:Ig-like domain-containing protein [Terracidiphilus sp.]